LCILLEQLSETEQIASGFKATTQPEESSETKQETVHFLDENIGQFNDISGKLDNVNYYGAPSLADLGEFLSRPVRIYTFTWNESDATGTSIDLQPWFLFFSNAFILKKLDNYAFIRCKLHLKFVINASPFYYGAYRFCYKPNYLMTGSTIRTDAGNRHLIPFSQQPGVWLYPSSSAGAEMELPFLINADWMRIQVATDVLGMGNLKGLIYVPLRSANGVTGTGCTIQVFAWATDVELAGPTIGNSLQGDEYVPNTIEKCATNVARCASLMYNNGIIAPFALATNIVASAVAGVSHIFGWTNVPNIKDIDGYQPKTNPTLASSEISFPVEKLTLDPKNELTIDPGIAGCGQLDELLISNYAGRNSFIYNITWDTTTAVDTSLFACGVTPNLFTSVAFSGSNYAVYMTPMCHAALLFANWRGDIIFTFRVIASPFHKGRVRISYDPQGNGTNIGTTSSDSSPVVFTQIIDIGKDTMVEMRIPYSQATSYLNTSSDLINAPFADNGFMHTEGFTNGSIVMRCLTTLSAPVSSSTVNIIVSARGAENIEFANPSSLLNNSGLPISYAPPQGEAEEEQLLQIVAGKQHIEHPYRHMVYFGEAIVSLRTLCHRYAKHASMATAYNSGQISQTYNIRTFHIPRYPGYYTGGLTSLHGVISTGAYFAYNVVNWIPILWLAPCFIGLRGSFMEVVMANCSSVIKLTSVRASRKPDNTSASIGVSGFTSTITTYPNNNYNSISLCDISGSSITNPATQANLNVLYPYMNRFKFKSTQPSYSNVAVGNEDGLSDMHTIDISVMGSGTSADFISYDSIIAAGPDMQLLFFTNVPTVYVYSGFPTP